MEISETSLKTFINMKIREIIKVEDKLEQIKNKINKHTIELDKQKSKLDKFKNNFINQLKNEFT
jgi:hypothetical protein